MKGFVILLGLLLLMACGTIKVPATNVETTGGTDTGTGTSTGTSGADTGTTTAQQPKTVPTSAPTATTQTTQALPAPTTTTTTTTTTVTVVQTTVPQPVLTVYSVNALQNLTTECVVNVMTSIQSGQLVSELQPDAQVLLANPLACTVGRPYAGETYIDPISGIQVVEIDRPRVCTYWARVGAAYSYNYQVDVVDVMQGETVTQTRVVSVSQ